MRADSISEPSWNIKPEAHPTFRLARLLIVVSETERHHRCGVTLDRLAYYEFFAANPFLIFASGDEEWGDLVSVGQEVTTVGYSSTHHRFITRRQQMRHDLGALAALGLISIHNNEGRIQVSISPRGHAISGQIRSLYAQALVRSTALVIKKLSKLSDTKLAETAPDWLNHHPVYFELGF